MVPMTTVSKSSRDVEKKSRHLLRRGKASTSTSSSEDVQHGSIRQRRNTRTRALGFTNNSRTTTYFLLIAICLSVIFWVRIFGVIDPIQFVSEGGEEKRKEIDIETNTKKTNPNVDWLPEWALDPVLDHLTTKNTELIDASAMHAKELFERAKQALEQDGDVIYGKLHSPLLGYLLPKAGSNTLGTFAAFGLAAAGGAPINRLCVPPDRYSCMYERNDTGCSVSFSHHIRPLEMVKVIVNAEKKGSNCKRWPRNPLNTASEHDSFREIHERSVCLLIFRHPVDRALSAYYEWYYKKKSNLTAFEYLDQHGREGYVKEIGNNAHYKWVPEELWPIILENCLVGVTDKYDVYSETLSRVLKFPKRVGSKALQARHHEHVGETPERLKKFQDQMTPVFAKSIELYQLIRKISFAQFEEAKSYLPLYPVYKEKSFKCKSCSLNPRLRKGNEWSGLDVVTCEDWGSPEIVEEVSESELKRDYVCVNTSFVS